MAGCIGLLGGAASGFSANVALPAVGTKPVESGVPAFVVLGPEALGLSTMPIDLHLLPDGRVLVVAARELAFSDGVRWETFRSLENQPPVISSVAVDGDGQIYTGLDGCFARIEFGEGARWHFTPVMTIPGLKANQHLTLPKVTMFPDQWFWYGSANKIVSWRPGQTAHVAGKIGAIDRVFMLGSDIFLSELSIGRFFRLTIADSTVTQVSATEARVSEAVNCAIPFGPGQLLVGTNSAGMKLFDGTTLRPFGPPGPLNSGHRISDLCLTDEGLFAAAVDTIGIVFFDREGKTVQLLDRVFDHRLARVRKLQYDKNGVLWVLLNEGVARVEFPTPLSHFEPLLASGLVYAEPLRHAGELWVLADGRAMHGIYDASGRLERFEGDTPPGDFLFTMAEIDGQLFASNEAGIYLYEAFGWKMILSGIVNARLGVARSTRDGLYYVARGEYGIIQRNGDSFTARRIMLPSLGNTYNAKVGFRRDRLAGVGHEQRRPAGSQQREPDPPDLRTQ